MSTSSGAYAFLPWLRRGVSAQIERVDGEGPAAARGVIPAHLSLNEGTLSADVRLSLYGPGEVTGIDPRVVVRSWPRADIHDAENNYFPLIEFAQADLPWRYTPARANRQDRLRPWLCLVVLKDDEVEGYEEAARPLPVVTVKNASSLPPLEQSWAWAHVQLSGPLPREGAAAILADEPHRAISRLLCARRLATGSPYTAFVVPAFDRGRKAGLGEEVGDEIDGLAPAWSASGRSVRLPIYYRWRFQTAALPGDFASLVRQMEARALPDTVGIRGMDVSTPDPRLPAASAGPLGLEGALKTPSTRSSHWDDTERARWIERLQNLLNRPAELLGGARRSRVVAPPLYGQWHCARSTLEPGGHPVWFQELNSDPRLRAAASLGTAVVIDQQQQLMASAWQQVDGILAINERMRLAQLTRAAATSAFVRHLARGSAELVLMVTAPLHGHIRGSAVTIRKLLQDSPIVEGAFEPQLRRASRRLGPIGRRQGRAQLPGATASGLLERMNSGELSPALPPPRPESLATPQRTGAALVPSWVKDDTLRLLRRLARWLRGGGLLLLLIALLLLLFAGPVSGVFVLAGVGFAALGGGFSARRWARKFEDRIALRDAKLNAGTIRQAPPRPGLVVQASVPGERPSAARPSRVGSVIGGDSRSALEFRAAAAALLDRLNTPVAEAPPRQRIDLAALSEKVVNALDPRATVVASFRARLHLPDGLPWEPEDPLEEVMVAPEFPQPMYKPLSKISQDWLLPGLDKVPANTVSLLETNQRFVEAYMTGLNHEMARELRWNEYPTDQRGSYFRQFWDARGYVARSGEAPDREGFKDIEPIHTWRRGSPLGGNTSRRLPPGGEHLVLLVRGDLLRRYPNAHVYAVKAKLGAEGTDRGKRVLGEPEEHPVFSGDLAPDVSFFGFELTLEEVRGAADSAGDQGWFFVFQEQPSEPRFGLNAAGPAGGSPTSWGDLSWGHFAANDTELDALNYIDLASPLPDTSRARRGDPAGAVWHAEGAPRGTRSSDIAYITLQQHVRIAIHGSDMLRAL